MCITFILHSLLNKIDWSKRKCICRFLHKDEDGKLRLVKKPFFEIPLSIMDIWYTQALMWWVYKHSCFHSCCCILVTIILQAWIFLLSLFTTDYNSHITTSFLCTKGKKDYLVFYYLISHDSITTYSIV